MYLMPEKDEKKEEITGENKYLLDQMNAEALRNSRQLQAQKEQEEREAEARIREEERRRADEAARIRRIQGVNYHIPAMQPINFVPAQDPHPLNNGFMTDEEMARMLQEEEYEEGLFNL
jgi:hypothetical protein